MSTISVEEAREIVADVREQNGGITAEDREFLAANRPRALRALQNTRRQLADSIKIVVDNLYSKETRFVYELIQNAEDNSYSRALAEDEKPFLAFKVYPERIIVDSNEDGFSESNIRAICSIGNSTKKHSPGYVGEKGIGFKSVFKIAQKVHIQSGPFSFAFSHTRDDDDDGLGMITPYDEPAEDLGEGVRTRMVLTLLDSTKFEERSSELRQIPDTFLMFLSQLQRLSVELCAPNETSTTTHFTKREAKENGLCTTFLTKTAREGQAVSNSEQKYYTMKSNLHNLPFDEARKDKLGNNIDLATVVLAFPIDERNEPILKPQYTFAFLPLRRVGFNFLIQSDFVTQANREDVVHSQRNRAVLEGVANAFVDAMVMFCQHPSLRYQWMRYLPEDSITDDFWRTLWPLMKGKLERMSLLEPWSGKGLYKPSDLEKLSERCLDQDGNPLLPDLEGAEVYLSPKYTEGDFQLLRRLGTRTLQWGKIIDRLEADLEKFDSQWRNMDNSNDWRTRICKILNRVFDHQRQDFPGLQKRLRTLSLIPLCEGQWVSSSLEGPLYFPKVDDVFIPVDLGMALVQDRTVENIAWANLLSTLSVKSCSSSAVIDKINKRYDVANLANFTLCSAIAHIRFLYHFLSETSRLAPQIRLVNHHGSLLKSGQYLYFPDEADEYSPTQLFKQDNALKLPGYPVHFLHRDYLNGIDSEAMHNGRSWMRWLGEVAGVRRTPVLQADSPGLSREFGYIIEYRSNRLLGTLKRGWAQYSPLVDGALKIKLQSTAVFLEHGSRATLSHTFLPFPNLKQIATELYIVSFPFVAMSEQLNNDDISEWSFTKDLGIGVEENLRFYLAALKALKRSNFLFKMSTSEATLAKIYGKLQTQCINDLDYAQAVFKNPLIWIPPSNKSGSKWVSSTDCVWNGPQWLKSKQCLKLGCYDELEHLFKVSLKISDANQLDVLDDLQMLKSHSENVHASKSQSTVTDSSDTSSSSGNKPFEVTVEKQPFETNHFQSITLMEAYRSQSFEELRLSDYDAGRTPRTGKPSISDSKAFAGIQIEEIVKEAEKRYDYLWHKHSSSANSDNSDNRKALRLNFEDAALVYIPQENAWFRPSHCVWVESSVKIPNKASIATAYPSKKTFFTQILQVSEPTVGMYVESLKSEANGGASAAHIKETMVLICGLDFEDADLSSLVEAKVLPIEFAHGGRGLASASFEDGSADFAILETTIHRKAFRDKTTVLDFSLEELRDTRPLLLAIGLGKKFSTKLVDEVTDVSGGHVDTVMTRILRVKSQAIVRCALHFASLNKRQAPESLYRKFRLATVHLSDGIGRFLRIRQNGRSIESASSRANFHVEERGDGLQLYLPKNEVEREVCFESDLPRRLCALLDITDPAAPGVIGGVFRKDNLAVIDRILENAGVGQVEGDFAALNEEFGAAEPNSEGEAVAEATNDVRLSTPSPGPSRYTPSGWASWRDKRSRSANADDGRETVRPNSTLQELSTQTQETAYKGVLENLVNIARARVHSGIFETSGVSVQGAASTRALPSEMIREAFAARTQERDFKLGAAGELYVFEYLKGLDLPNFTVENWKSSIRDRVQVHPEYYNLEKDNSRSAIADIEYPDVLRRFTQFLVQKGHLAKGLWDREEPFYHIEVKATTSPNWQEPFFMSKAQERHIQDKRIENGRTRSSIYIICRIFNIGRGDETGMHIYLDPETKRRNRELEFTAHTWAVKPLVHPNMLSANGPVGPSAGQTPGAQKPSTEPSAETRDGGSHQGQNPSGNALPLATKRTIRVKLPGHRADETEGKGLLQSSGFENHKSTKTPNTLADAAGGSSPFGRILLNPSLPGNKNPATHTRAVSTGNYFGPSANKDFLFSTPRPPSADSGPLASSPTAPRTTARSSSMGRVTASTEPAITSGSLFGTKSVSSNSNTTQAPAPSGLFGSSNTTSSGTSNRPDPKATKPSGSSLFSTYDFSKPPPSGGWFGSEAVSATTDTKAAPITGLFGTKSNSDTSKDRLTRTLGSGFDIYSNTTSVAPSTKGLFGSNTVSPQNDNLKASATPSIFGNRAVSPSSEPVKAPPVKFFFESAKPSTSSSVGSLFGTTPSSSTDTGSVFNTTANTTGNAFSLGATGFSGLGTSSPASRSGFATNAATPPQEIAQEEVTNPQPKFDFDVSTLFGTPFVPYKSNAPGETRIRAISGSPSTLETPGAQTRAMSSPPISRTIADSEPTFGPPKESALVANLTPSLSVASIPKPGIAQMSEADGSRASISPVAAEATALVSRKQPIANIIGTSGETQNAHSHTRIADAVKNFYSLLTALPYIPQDAIVFPPETGWPDVDAKALRGRGKTEKVIELLRHLPYLRSPTPTKRWMTGPATVSIPYCDGELYHLHWDRTQPLPGHCIWLMEGASGDGTGLILDTHTGSITEYTYSKYKTVIDDAEYEQLPRTDQWMAHPTMDATRFFQLWKRKFERLVWMPVYDINELKRNVSWFITAETKQDEEDILTSDDDFEPDIDEDSGSGNDIESDSDEEPGSDDGQESDADSKNVEFRQSEGDQEKDDDQGNEADCDSDEESESVEKPNSDDDDCAESVPGNRDEVISDAELDDLIDPYLDDLRPEQRTYSALDTQTKEVYRIYTSNGWPSHFDREKCRLELADFLKKEKTSSSKEKDSS